MRINKEGLRRTTQMLRQAHLAKNDVGTDGLWQDRVMARIRETGRPEARHGFAFMVGQSAWRLAPATCPLAIGLAALTVKMFLAFHYDLAQMVVNHAEHLMLAQIFGV